MHDAHDAHTAMQQLTQNRKSWFNQDLFKEINSSIEEHYGKQQARKEEQNKANQMHDDSDYETASEDSDQVNEERWNEKDTNLKRKRRDMEENVC